ncbi:cytochrome P450 [Nocardia sp. NBC_00511]|uniref:cytochrome P450 n=1 Tax=Nocardia sp. NBC_00511 TaxID=2903591 RepID=UPI002F907301
MTGTSHLVRSAGEIVPITDRKSHSEYVPTTGLSQAAAASALDTDQLAFPLEMARRFGPIVQLWPGVIQVTGADVVDSVLRRTNRDFFVDRNFLFRKIDYGSKASQVKLDAWMKLRRTAMSAMTPARFGQHAPWLIDQANILVDSWLRRGSIAGILPEVAQLTGASITRFTLGDRHARDVRAATDAMLDALRHLSLGRFEWPGYIRAVQPREWRARRTLNDFMEAVHASLKTRDRNGLIDVMSQPESNEAAAELVKSLLLNGQEAPAAAVCWALVELARNPEEQERAASAASRWDGSLAVPKEIGRVVDETLRLWPPAPLSGRVTGESVSLGSWMLPAGSTILLPFNVIHRTAERFPEPDRFDSTRWTLLSPPHGSYVPFGGGARSCLGARFARFEVATILAAVLRQSRVTLNGSVRPNPGRILTPVGFDLRLRPRR